MQTGLERGLAWLPRNALCQFHGLRAVRSAMDHRYEYLYQPPCCRRRAVVKRFGGITATNNVTLNLQRAHAMHHRPQRRRQDHAHQPADRRAGAHRRLHHARRGQDITRLAPHQRVQRGMVAHLPDQPAVRHAPRHFRNAALTVSQHPGPGQANGGSRWARVKRSMTLAEQLLEQFHLPYGMAEETRAGLRQAPPTGDCDCAGLQSHACCCSTRPRGRVCLVGERESYCRQYRGLPPMLGAVDRDTTWTWFSALPAA